MIAFLCFLQFAVFHQGPRAIQICTCPELPCLVVAAHGSALCSPGGDPSSGSVPCRWSTYDESSSATTCTCPVHFQLVDNMKTLHCISLCLAATFLSAHPSAAQGTFATGLSNAGLNAFRDVVLPMVNQELAAFSVSMLSLRPCRIASRIVLERASAPWGPPPAREHIGRTRRKGTCA